MEPIGGLEEAIAFTEFYSKSRFKSGEVFCTSQHLLVGYNNEVPFVPTLFSTVVVTARVLVQLSWQHRTLCVERKSLALSSQRLCS